MEAVGFAVAVEGIVTRGDPVVVAEVEARTDVLGNVGGGGNDVGVGKRLPGAAAPRCNCRSNRGLGEPRPAC